MRPKFHQFNQAVKFTLEFYNISKIKDHLLIFEGKDPNNKLKTDWYDLVFSFHEKMEEEILQTIQTANHNTQLYFFEHLKEWLNDYRIASVHIPTITEKIEDFNQKRLDEFEVIVQNNVDKFQSTNEYKTKGHLEEYTETIIGRGLILKKDSLINRKLINYKYYCITDYPDLISYEHLDKYIQLLTKLIDNLRNILSKYAKLYIDGKIKSNDLFNIEPKKMASLKEDLLVVPTTKKKKLTSKITIPQLAYLFKMLNEEGIIESNTFKEIHEMISENFRLSTKGNEEIISVKKLSNVWSDYDIKVSNYWKDKFIDLHNRAKKDNPNNI